MADAGVRGMVLGRHHDFTSYETGQARARPAPDAASAAGIDNRIYLYAVDPGFNFDRADTQSKSYADTARERTVEWVARFAK